MSTELKELWWLVLLLIVVGLPTVLYILFQLFDAKSRLAELEEWQDQHQWKADRASGMPPPSEHLTRPWARRR